MHRGGAWDGAGCPSVDGTRSKLPCCNAGGSAGVCTALLAGSPSRRPRKSRCSKQHTWHWRQNSGRVSCRRHSRRCVRLQLPLLAWRLHSGHPIHEWMSGPRCASGRQRIGKQNRWWKKGLSRICKQNRDLASPVILFVARLRQVLIRLYIIAWSPPLRRRISSRGGC